MIIPWLCSFAKLSSVLILWADRELILEALETPLVEGGVDGADGTVWGVVERGGVGFWASMTGIAAFTSSLFESLLLLAGGSELFRKSNSMSSSKSCSLFLGLTKPDEALAELGALLLLPGPEVELGTFAVPASRVALDLLMFPAAAEM